MKLVWFPAWSCQNYGPSGTSFGQRCPYCPYGLDKDTNRLVFENRPTSSDDRADASDLVEFFLANFTTMAGHLEVSGGEPLMRQDLPEILQRLPHRWAITSNTLMRSAVTRLIDTEATSRCVAWTASWHPCSGMEDSYAYCVQMLAQDGIFPRATVVIADATLPRLRDSLAFLQSLPLSGINWHLDTHGPADVSHLKAAADELLGPGAVLLAGPPPQGRMCHRHERLMAVGADGSLYQCVTFAYQDIDPICKVSGDVLLSALPPRVEWCDVPCMACCDHVKHD